MQSVQGFLQTQVTSKKCHLVVLGAAAILKVFRTKFVWKKPFYVLSKLKTTITTTIAWTVCQGANASRLIHGQWIIFDVTHITVYGINIPSNFWVIADVAHCLFANLRQATIEWTCFCTSLRSSKVDYKLSLDHQASLHLSLSRKSMKL